MFKKTIAVAVLALLNNAAFAATDIYSGQVSFSGIVEEAACAISAGDVTGQTIDMGNVRLGELAGAAGTPSAVKTPFKITLNECSSTVAPLAKIKFSGTTAPGFDTILVGGTTNIGVEIFDKSGQALPFGTDSATYDVVDGVTELQFNAGYAAATDTPVAGQVNATATFQVTYQ